MKEEDEESGGPSASHIAVEKASFGRSARHCNAVTALTEADGSEKSHLCSISIPLSCASGLPCACQLLMQHWFTLDSREVSWRKATVYWGQNSREGKSNSSSVMPTSALWSTRRSRLGESRPLRVFSNGPMAMFPGKQMK